MPLEGEVAAGLTLHEETTTGIHGVGAGTLVGTTLAQTLTLKTLTTPVIASLYQDAAKTKLVTMPAATDTLIGKATTDTLTNKTLTSPTINGTIATTGLTLPAFTLGGTVTLNGKAFDAGSGNEAINTTGTHVLIATATNDGATGAIFRTYHASASPAVNDIISQWEVCGKDSAGNFEYYGKILWTISDPASTSEDGAMSIQLLEAGTINTALTLASTGVLSVDLAGSGTPAQVDLFDDLDDAVILKQGVSERQLEVLEKIGVVYRKDTGSGWMLNIQHMLYLLAGGIYQNRARIDKLSEEVLRIGGRLEWQKELETP